MIEFEKFYKTLECADGGFPCYIAEESWKAALEWVLNNFNAGVIGNEAIEKELKNLNQSNSKCDNSP